MFAIIATWALFDLIFCCILSSISKVVTTDWFGIELPRIVMAGFARLSGLRFQIIRLLFWPFRRSRVNLSTSLSLWSGSKLILRRGARIEALGRVEIFERGTAQLGLRVRVARGAELIVTKDATLSIADDVSIGSYCNIRTERSITIGKRVLIAQHVSIIGGQYSFERRDTPIWEQPYVAGDVTLGEDCWIGVGATILSNVSIGVGAIVAAGAVVTKDVADYSIFGGVPARQIGIRP